MLKFLLTILMVFSLNACVTEGPKPKLVSRVNPVYPIYAYDNKIEGYAKVRYDVDKDGKVSEIRIVESSPRGLFENALVMAMSKWRFEKNKPYKNLEITIRFKMSSPISQ
ncbi:TonB family protein [Serratia marcescens]|uniref:TonB family protein n=1 Tax=Serratia marcescens TaxID=615 RepID=UPI0007C91BC7|nr:TonB family protein [Serratia marcescens]